MKMIKYKILLSKFVSRIPYIPVYIVFLLDLFVISFIAFFISIFFQTIDKSYLSKSEYFFWSCIIVFCLGLVMSWKKTYRGIVRFTDIFEVINFVNVFLFSIALFLFFFLSNSVLDLGITVPLSYILLVHIGAFVNLILYRLLVKEVFSKMRSVKKRTENVLIFGAGQMGMFVFQLLKRQINSPYNIIGFFDDDKRKISKRIFGVKIFSGDTQLEEQLVENQIVEVILAARNISNKRKKELFDLCYKHHVKISLLPSFKQMDLNKLELRDLRSIKLEELLGRDPIELNQSHLNESFEGKVVLVTGAGGSIGSELCRQISTYPIQKLVLLDSAESALYDINQELLRKNLSIYIEPVLADVRNKRQIHQIFAKYKPSYVFHAAAYKHVPLMETFPKLAIETNVIGSRILADCAVEFGVEKFILISTDKAVNPTNVMGATKRMAELYIQSKFHAGDDRGSTQFITTRFGNVLGSNGSVIPLFMKQIESGGPVTVTHQSIERFFMTIPEACRLVMEAGSMGKGGEIYVFDMGEPVKIYDLAEKMIRLTGKTPNQDISIEITGLRSGEKLYEELVGSYEEFKATHHPKIHIVQSYPAEFHRINQTVTQLEEGIKADKNEDYLIYLIKNTIPEFVSSYSRFSVLDK
jgi:FlaA1/EpsC-like NDP-sugar epimerase